MELVRLASCQSFFFSILIAAKKEIYTILLYGIILQQPSAFFLWITIRTLDRSIKLYSKIKSPIDAVFYSTLFCVRQ